MAAFLKSGLNCISKEFNATQSLWGYTTNDLQSDVVGASYFDSVADQLAVGDIILATCDLDGTALVSILLVSAISGADVVTVKPVIEQISLTALTSAAGTAAAGTVDVTSSFDQAKLNNNFATLVTRINEISNAMK